MTTTRGQARTKVPITKPAVKKKNSCGLTTISLSEDAITAGNEQTAILRVTYYVLKEKKGSAYNWLVERIADECYLEQVLPHEIRNGILTEKKFDVVFMPGGMAPRHYEYLKDEGVAKVKEFVRNGGGYVGICAGAYNVCVEHKDYDCPWNYGLIRVQMKDLDHWNRGSGDVCRITYTTVGKKTMCDKNTNKEDSVYRYANGPLFDILPKCDDPDVGEPIVFATFSTEFTNNGAPKGVMKGTPAVVGGTYGKGRALACSPHPEKSALKYAVQLKNMFKWASQKLK
jgi:putative intracellular protease/amidase